MSCKPIVRAWSDEREPKALVEQLNAQFASLSARPAGIILFRAPEYDDVGLAHSLRAHFDCPIASCTTAGEILDDYRTGSAVAIGFSSEYFAFRQLAIEDLKNCDYRQLPALARDILQAPVWPGSKRFGLLLVDGLSIREEALVGQLYQAFGGLPLLGGSAGDNLLFQQTRVYCNGSYRENAATFTVVESLLPFETLRIQHFEPSGQDLVITRSDSARRIVYEIDGAPAARQLARLLGIKEGELTPQVFSKYPMMLQIGPEWYVRSVQKVNADGSLSFYCAIDDGLPLTVAAGVGLVETPAREVNRIEAKYSRVHLTLGVDCVLRRLEIEEKSLNSQVNPLLKRLQFAGFSSYGEQFQALHVNQTLTAVVVGDP